MKLRQRIFALVVVVLLGVLPLQVSAKSAAVPQQPSLAPQAKSVILMDAASGTVIFERHSHAKLPPASITKVMTMLLIVEAIDEDVIQWKDKVTTSEYAASMGGSQIFLNPGEEMTVEEMLKGIAMASGNDASVAMAEKIAGTEAEFVRLMNERAQQLGMKNTHFSNCNGLPADNHYTTAYDIAIMSRELLKHDEITKFTGAYQDYLRKDSEEPFWLVNTNKLVRFYAGADGLKTGFTTEAKFCLTGTAKRDGMRVVAVVMGEPNTTTRNAEVAQLFDYAFAQYQSYPLFKKGDVMGTATVENGNESKVTIKAKHDYSVLVKKGSSTKQIRYELKMQKLQAPIKLNQSIGKIVVYQGNQVLSELEVDSPTAIARAGWLTLLKRTVHQLF